MAEAAIHIALKTAVGYVRCSTEMQEDSPEQQKKEILAFAEQYGYKVIDWYEDFGKSGTTFEQRPEFNRLREAVEAQPAFKTVICYDESRWGRAIESEENAYWRHHFKRHGIDVILVKTSVDQNSEIAPVVQALEGMQASQYSKKLSELTLRGAKNNGKYSSGGTPPYGYKRVAVDLRTLTERELQPGHWCIRSQEKVKFVLGDKREVETVKKIFQMRVDGLGWSNIAHRLSEQGILCPRKGVDRNRDGRWSPTAVRAILVNPAYYGVRIYNRISSSKIQAKLRGRQEKSDVDYPVWRNDESEWKVEENAHEPIVSRDLWERANAIRRNRTLRRNPQRYNSVYLFTGLIKCGQCGYAYQGWSGSANGREYFRYIDSGVKKASCGFHSIPKDDLEEFGVSVLKNTLSDPIMVQAIEEQLASLLESEPPQNDEENDRIEKQISANEIKVKNLVNAIAEGTRAQPLQELINKLESENERLRVELQSLRRDIPRKVSVADIAGHVREFISSFEVNFEKASLEDRKVLIKKCISEIVVDKKAKVVRFYVRTIPKVNAELGSIVESLENGGIVSSECARNRT